MNGVHLRGAIVAGIVLCGVLAGSADVAGAAPQEPIVVIVLENKTYSQIVGSPDAPYIQTLIKQGTLYTNYHGAPGSLPDYLRMTSGLATLAAAAGSDNLFHQLQTSGVSWGEYEESMPTTCYKGSGPTPYDKGHNPAIYYRDIFADPAACARTLPFGSFSPSALRAFSYIVPNNFDNMHTGSSKTAEIRTGDAWLKNNVPAMVHAGALVILTWDEGSKSDEHVATIAVGGGAAAGVTDGHAYTHYSLLSGLEHVFGEPLLHSAATATRLPIK